ncbi:MAG: hypothetical protein HUU21_12240 [Polyangiaceae bacterium]|nr:hypothetical protein [Polyangiaceae bacterium]
MTTDRNTPRNGRARRSDRELRCLRQAEADRLWLWICGSLEGGGFIRGDLAATAQALGLKPRHLNRILSTPETLLRVRTIEKLLAKLDALERTEAAAAARLSRLSWSEMDNIAEDERGKWYARYSTPSGWAYITGTGRGYDTEIEARFAASKMQIGAALRGAAE